MPFVGNSQNLSGMRVGGRMPLVHVQALCFSSSRRKKASISATGILR